MKIINSGIIELNNLYAFAEADRGGNGLHANSKTGRKFGKECSDLVHKVSEHGGFYIWGMYDSNCSWKNIYIGKAGFKKSTSLKARILEELKDERQFFWRTVLSENSLLEKCEEYYPEMKKVYINHWQRSLQKFNSTHVIWVAIDKENTSHVENLILQIESDLIETMNPTANIKRPKPIDTFIPNTIEVVNYIKQHIRDNRPIKPYIPIAI